MTPGMVVLALALLIVDGVSAQNSRGTEPPNESFLTWTAIQAEAIGEHAYRRGRVGGFFDGRLLKTERAYNYKLAATLLTPDVIRASARVHQFRSGMSNVQTLGLVAEAEAVGGIVVMVEIDPREGSGVIPLEWNALLQPQGGGADAVRGVNRPELRDVKALAGIRQRNYDYDRFWMVFPNDATLAFLQPGVQFVELIVRIHDKEGRVVWPAASLKVQPAR